MKNTEENEEKHWTIYIYYAEKKGQRSLSVNAPTLQNEAKALVPHYW